MPWGGTFLTFVALSFVGIPAVVANATSSVTQLPGYITSTFAYWSDIRQFWRGALVLCLVSAAGAVAGALRLNALKNLLSIVIAVVAILIFVVGGVVVWLQALVMVPSVALGGYLGVRVAKKCPQNLVRGFVACIGLALAAYYFITT